MCRFVLQSLLYPIGVSMDTLQASYSKPPTGEAQVQTLNRCVHLLQSVLISAVLRNVPSGIHMPLTSNVADEILSLAEARLGQSASPQVLLHQ